MPNTILNVATTPEYMQVFEFEKYDYKNFQTWVKDEGNWTLSIYASAIYLLCILFGDIYMENRKPYEVKKHLVWWNIFQAMLSALVFLRMSPELFTQFKERDLHSTFCS